MSHASGMGSSTNHPVSRQREDRGPGILWSVHRWTKKKNRPYTGPVLLRQGEPGTSQYIIASSLVAEANFTRAIMYRDTFLKTDKILYNCLAS